MKKPKIPGRFDLLEIFRRMEFGELAETHQTYLDAAGIVLNWPVITPNVTPDGVNGEADDGR